MKKISVILLAAGKSERMGTCKQLLDLGGRTVIQVCIENLLEAGLDDITVVAGVFSGELQPAVSNFNVMFIINDIKNAEMSDSIRAGLKSTGKGDTSGIMIHLSDHPLVKASTLRSLAEKYSDSRDSVIIPAHNGRKGHPVILPEHILRKIEKGGTLRDIISSESGKVRQIDVDDQGILVDMDTPGDYQRVLECHISDIRHKS